MAPTPQKEYVSAAALAIGAMILISLLLTAGLFTKFNFLPFALIIGVLWLMVNLKYQFVGLIVYTLFILVRPNEFVGFLQVPFPIEKALASCVILGLIIKMIRDHGPKIKYNVIDLRVTIFVAVALLSVVTAIWVQGALGRWQDLFRLFVVYILISRIIESERQLKVFVFITILTTAFHAFAATINYYRGIREFEMGIDRALGLDSSYGDPNSLAATIICTLPFIYYCLIGARSLATKIFLVIIFLGCMWCVVLTGSRTGMIAIVMLMMLTLFQHGNKVRSAFIALLILVGGFLVLPDQYRQRLYSSTDLSGDTGASMSAQGRIAGLVNGIRMMIDHPLLGVGVGMYSAALGMQYGHGYWEAHNLPGQLFGDLGLLGTIAFIAWMTALFKSLGKLSRHYDALAPQKTFMKQMVVASRLQLLCLFFLGLGGHNLYRYSWLIQSAMIVVMLKLAQRDKIPEGTETPKEEPVLSPQNET